MYLNCRLLNNNEQINSSNKVFTHNNPLTCKGLAKQFHFELSMLSFALIGMSSSSQLDLSHPKLHA